MDTNWVEYSEGGLAPDIFAEKIFPGRIVVFEALADVAALVERTRRMLGEVFGGLPPTTAFETLGADAYREHMKRARAHFRKSEDISWLYRRALIAAGADPETTFIDKLSLRSAPPFDTPYAPGFGTLPPHRDSWGAGLDCQINWWLPFYEITPERTMAIFPRYWDHPIANNSEGWTWQRAMKEPGYPTLPTAQEPVDWGEAIYLVVSPGSLVAFSGSHLHATVPNTTRKARISSDTRTVDLAHLRQGRGAPNVDRAASTPSLDWFHNIESGQPLSNVT
jgi:hypothetical protein